MIDGLKQKIERDYDKEPIVVENNIAKCQNLAIIYFVILSFCFAFIVLVSGYKDSIAVSFLPIVMILINTKKELADQRNTKIYFTNTKIIKKQGERIIESINTNEIFKLLKTINSGTIYPHIDVGLQKLGMIAVKFYIVVMPILILTTLDGFLAIISLILVSLMILVILLPQFILSRKSKIIDPLFDVLLIEDKNGKFLNFTIHEDKDYKILHKYFLSKTYKNLNKVQKKFTANDYLLSRKTMRNKK